MDTPEALNVRQFNPLQPNNSIPVEINDINSAGTSVVIYDRSIPSHARLRKIIVQNRSLQPCYYQNDADSSVDGGVLAGGTAANDGLGSRVTFDFRKDSYRKISFYSVTGNLNIQLEKYEI